MKDATLAQGNQIINLILQKRTPASQLQALIKSGFLGDILDANIENINRNSLRSFLGLKPIPPKKQGTIDAALFKQGIHQTDLLVGTAWKKDGVTDVRLETPVIRGAQNFLGHHRFVIIEHKELIDEGMREGCWCYIYIHDKADMKLLWSYGDHFKIRQPEQQNEAYVLYCNGSGLYVFQLILCALDLMKESEIACTW